MSIKSEIKKLSDGINDYISRNRSNRCFYEMRAIRDPAAVKPLINIIKKGYSSRERAAAAYALGQIKDGRAFVPLTALLLNKSAIAREASAQALGEMGDPRAIEPLVKLLNDKESAVRAAATQALGLIGDPHVTGIVVKQLGDIMENVRMAAKASIEHIKDPKEIEYLTAVLKNCRDYRPEARVIALELIAGSGSALGTDLLIFALEDPDVLVRSAAAELLGKNDDPKNTKALIKAYHQNSFDTQKKIVHALVEIESPDSVDTLIEALRLRSSPSYLNYTEDENTLHSVAAEALGEIGNPAATMPLIASLKDGSSAVSISAAEALGKIKDRRAVAPLKQALNLASIKKDDHLQRAAMWALGEIQDPLAVSVISRGLTSDDQNILIYTIKILRKFQCQEAVDALASIVGHNKPRIRMMAANALVDLGEYEWGEIIKGDVDDYKRIADSKKPQAVKILTNAVIHGDRDERIAASEALCGDRSKEAVDSLIRALKDEEPQVRALSAKGLGFADGMDVVHALLMTIEDESPEVRKAALTSLGLLKEPRAAEKMTRMVVDEFPDVRMSAAKALSNLDSPGQSEWTSIIRGDMDDYIRLGQSGINNKVDLLLPIADNPDPTLRIKVCEALSETNSSRAVDAILKIILHDTRKDVKLKAAKSLVKMENLSLGAVRTLIEIHASAEHDLRTQIAKSLSHSMDPHAPDALIKALGNSSGEVRREVAEALNQYGYGKWIEIIKGDTDDFDRLAKIDDLRAIYPLIHALENGPADVRKAAAGALGQIKDARTAEALISALDKEKSAGVRRAVARATVDMNDTNTEHLNILIKALGDEDTEVRSHMMMTLRHLIHHHQTVEMLIKAVQHEENNIDLRIAAIRLLAEIKAQEAVDSISALIHDKNHSLCIAATAASGELEDPAAIPALLDALKSSFSNVQIEAIRALQKLRNDSALDGLIKMLSNRNIKVVVAAVKALETLGNSEAIMPLIDLISNPSGEIRLAAAEALYALGEFQWKEIMKGDDEDYIRLGQSGQPMAASLLVKALEHAGYGKENFVVSDSLITIARALGETSDICVQKPLSKLIQFKANDISDSKPKGNIYVELRKAAAVSLIKLARALPKNKILSDSLLKAIRKPHADSSEKYHEDMRHGQSNDCSMVTDEIYYKHTDEGIGVDIKDF